MIACFVDEIESEKVVVEGESFIHLKSSLRVKEGDSVLALDGKGRKRETIVSKIGKKSILLTEGVISTVEPKFNLDVLLGTPKREALNDCLRFACEIGIRRIFLFHSEYSQNKKTDKDRIDKVLKSSLVQSNNPFLPEIINIEGDLVIDESYSKVILFHLDEESSKLNDLSVSPKEECLLALGPEGGFSPKDIEAIKNNFENVEKVQLDTEILRTPTALCVASGWLLSKM